jgi:hypothetical protein
MKNMKMQWISRMSPTKGVYVECNLLIIKILEFSKSLVVLKILNVLFDVELVLGSFVSSFT